ncbi:MAG: GTP pyrophosphokinase family protein [Clostridiales bacterium]|nr:GTP pyrophosphokinase family protein [Clostridiales bacterium]
MEQKYNDSLPQLFSRDNARKWIERRTMPFRSLMAYYNCAIMEVTTKFNVLNEEFSLQHDRNPIETVKSRLKSPESIAEKLNRKKLPPSTDAVEKYINDVAGVRVVCSFIDDVYTVADAFLMQDDITLIEIKDYIKNPKDNGYRSLHLIIEVPIFLSDEKRSMKVEIQLRTIAMDFWASLDHQIKYKKHISNEEHVFHELKDCANSIAEIDRRMSKLKEDIDD